MDDPVRFESTISQLVSASGGSVVNALKVYLAAEEAVADCARSFVRKGGLASDKSSVTDLERGLETLMAERTRLPDWVLWVRASRSACSEGLGPLVGALESGMIAGAAVKEFERAYAAWWLPLAMDASPALRGFTRSRHETAIEAFRKFDDAAARLASVEVMRRIAHSLPARHGVPRKSELGVLRHQLGLTRPSVSICALLESLPNTFGKLAPCVLMSPLSVAQYLPAGQAAFDVVIFDEASQITTWDAIGAIARARQTIIVGDPKQLPPTNFFGRADDDDEDLPEVERDLQGDERDVMLFSVTFGPDLAGKLTMNFGAINGTGGEKRLNVAITRARREFHVFSSVRAEQIDLTRTHAVGVRDLKCFLDYAERGPVALPSRDEGSLGPAESPFEEAVANALGVKGWEVRTQVGVSGFRVDLGVVHPDYAGSYIAGVECDGAQYHSSATARDRDKVRQAVLEGLGWTILRIWSTEWFRDPIGVTERVHAELERVLEKDRELRASTAVETEGPPDDVTLAGGSEPVHPRVIAD